MSISPNTLLTFVVVAIILLALFLASTKPPSSPLRWQMTVYALMIETSVEGEFYFDVDSLYTTYDKAEEEAVRRGLSKWHYYVEPMEVV